MIIRKSWQWQCTSTPYSYNMQTYAWIRGYLGNNLCNNGVGWINTYPTRRECRPHPLPPNVNVHGHGKCECNRSDTQTLTFVSCCGVSLRQLWNSGSGVGTFKTQATLRLVFIYPTPVSHIIVHLRGGDHVARRRAAAVASEDRHRVHQGRLACIYLYYVWYYTIVIIIVIVMMTMLIQLLIALLLILLFLVRSTCGVEPARRKYPRRIRVEHAEPQSAPVLSQSASHSFIQHSTEQHW